MQDANSQARATDIMNLAATAIIGQYYLGANSGAVYYSFANYLSDRDPASVATDTTQPWALHTKYYLGQGAWSQTFSVLEDGSIRRSGDTSAPAYQLYMQVYPPADGITPLRVLLSVAWPGVAAYGGSGWTNQQGQVETLIYANPPTPGIER